MLEIRIYGSGLSVVRFRAVEYDGPASKVILLGA